MRLPPGLFFAIASIAAVQNPRVLRFRQAPEEPPASPQATEPPAQEPPSQESPAAEPEVPSRPPLPAPIDFTGEFDLGAYEAALGRIAEAFPDLVRMRSLGKSRGGRDVWIAVVCDATAGDPRSLPGVVVLTGLAEPAAGPEAAVFALENLLVRARSEDELRAELRRSVAYFLPALDPDRAFPAAPDGALPPPRSCRLDRNFPARWNPFEDASGRPGPYPLSEPESRMIARFLLDRSNVSTAVVMTRGEDGASGDGEGRPGEAPGSLRAYCRDVLDLAVLEPRPWRGPAQETEVGAAPAGFQTAVAMIESAVASLPRLACEPARIERLRPDLWLVDVPLANAGLLPTLGRDGRRPGIPSVAMRVEGARVVACAMRGEGDGAPRAVRTIAASVPLGHLDGREAVEVRLVLQAAEGAEVDVRFESPRAGSAGAKAALR